MHRKSCPALPVSIWTKRACHASWWSRSCYLNISESRSWLFAPILNHDILSKILLMGLWGGSQLSTLPLKGYSSANHAYKAAQHWLQTSLYELEGVQEVFSCKSADLLSFPGCGLVDCMFTAHSDEQPVLCNHNVPFTGQPTILRNNLCRKFYISLLLLLLAKQSELA